MTQKKRILVVDDTPANIKILNDLLKGEYQVSVATNGSDALAIAGSVHKPDLILLDIMMPGMDGYEVCQKLKTNSRTAKIPVIFITAMEKEEDESKGFETGCVDYITKPFSPPLVLARVKTHIELQNAKASVDQLLSKTLIGSLNMMSDILSIMNPALFSQSARLKKYAGEIGRALKLSGLWRLEVAATLSQIGSISIPAEILNKERHNIPLSREEEDLFNAHPDISKEWLNNIPSLEIIGNIIAKQNENPPDTEFTAWDFITVSSQILKLVRDYDNLIIAGTATEKVIPLLIQQKESYSQELLNLLIEVEKTRPEIVVKNILLDELAVGMILVDDVICDSDKILVGKHTEISESILCLLEKNSRIRKIKEPIKIISQS